MKKVNLYHADFDDKRYTFYDNKFYKLIDGVREQNLINLSNNRNKLTEERYIFPNCFCETMDYRLVYETDILSSYITIDMALYLRMYLDVKNIAEVLVNVLMELESIGLIYYDYHGGNTLIDKDDNIKVCDLDSALYFNLNNINNPDYKDVRRKVGSRKMLLSFILELLTVPEDYSSFASLLSYNELINKMNILECLPEEVREYLRDLERADGYVLKTPVDKIINSLFEGDTESIIRSKAKEYNLRKLS